MKLYPFQQDAVAFHLAHHYSLNGSEMGLGKSAMALAVASELCDRPVVFGPAFLEASWRAEADKMRVGIKYVSYSQIHKYRPENFIGEHQLWIADEVHFLKTATTRRTHAFYDLLQKTLPEYFIGLTGTPIKNRVPDLWTLLAFCNLNPHSTSGLKLTGDLTHYKRFCRYFCHVEQLRFQKRFVERYGTVKEDKIPELKALLKDKMIRFLVADVLKDLPMLTRKEVLIPLAEVPGLEEEFKAYQAGHKADASSKKTSALLKAPGTIEYCKNLIEGGSGPLLIFTDHVTPAQVIADAITGAVAVTGGTDMESRQRFVMDFQRGAIPVLVATIGSLSVGVTLTAARHVVFNDLSWTPSDNLQAEKRIHRIGQKDACWSHFIDSTPTDAYIRKTLFAKLETIQKVIGD